jgi:hypothetical protein
MMTKIVLDGDVTLGQRRGIVPEWNSDAPGARASHSGCSIFISLKGAYFSDGRKFKRTVIPRAAWGLLRICSAARGICCLAVGKKNRSPRGNSKFWKH